MDPNEEIVVVAESLAYGRDAIAHHDGRVVFVEGAAPGDRVKAAVIRDHGSYLAARSTAILEAGAARTDPPCPLVDRCGGCPWQHVEYEEQLAAKRRAVSDALERIAGLDSPDVDAVVPSPLTEGYRNRLKLRFERGRLGFYSARSHSLVPIPDCLLAEDEIREALPLVESFVASLATRAIRVEIASRGELPGLVVAINSQGRLRRSDGHRIVELLAGESPVRGVVMWGKGWRRHWGEGDRRYTVDALGTQVSSSGASFGQVNTRANPLLVSRVVETVAAGSPSRVLDLFCGAGNFTLALARRCRRVVGVESDAAAVDAARAGAREQKLSNVAFHDTGVEEYLARDDVRGFDHVVVNPPRSGLRTCASELGARRFAAITYVSCNPATLARDVHRLRDDGYEVHSVAPFDLFPHSFHVETVCDLRLT